MARIGRWIGGRCGTITGKAEQALSISGPVSYPWGPKRPRYPYRAHEVNAAGTLLAKGAEALGYEMDADAACHRLGAARQIAALRLSWLLPLRLLDQRQAEHANTFIPRAIAAGAEIRDLAMAGRIEVNGRTGAQRACIFTAKATGIFRRARNVVVARLCHRDAAAAAELRDTTAFPDGLANSSGLVGKYLMTQSNQAVFGRMEEEVRWYKGPPSLDHHRALEL